jgi:hypothetical protein
LDTKTPEVAVLFRPGKKRKAYRQRPDGMEEKIDALDGDGGLAQKDRSQEPEDNATTSITEALRLRNSRKSRLNGVGFTAYTTPGSSHASTDMADERSLVVMAEEQPAQVVVGGITKRFAPQTGLTGELVNKHM